VRHAFCHHAIGSHRGEGRANKEAQEVREARDKARERKQKERESIQRLRGQG
jgi:predicted transposase YbfD/YdcC